MTGFLAIILAALALARPIARWIAGNAQETPSRSSQRSLSPPTEPKALQLQDQVNSKIHWDTPEREVLEWLSDKHGIEGDLAQSMLAFGRQARVRAIRERSLYRLMAAGIGMIATATPLIMEMLGGFVWILKSIALILAFGFCTASFGGNLIRFLSGRTDSTIDS